MVGEVRDFETAENRHQGVADRTHGAVDAAHERCTIDRHALAQHGHRAVFDHRRRSTSSSLNACAAYCKDCKAPIDVPKERLKDIQVPNDQVGKFQCFKGTGCANCSNTGYKGRIALYEVLVFAESLKEVVLNGSAATDLKGAAIRNGMQTLRMSALKKFYEGTTTVEEVVRVSVSD